jgi:hypothetical protein
VIGGELCMGLKRLSGVERADTRSNFQRHNLLGKPLITNEVSVAMIVNIASAFRPSGRKL